MVAYLVTYAIHEADGGALDNLLCGPDSVGFHQFWTVIFVGKEAYLKKREGVPEMGTKPLKALRGYRASNRGSNGGSRGSNRGSKGSRKTPEALRG